MTRQISYLSISIFLLIGNITIAQKVDKRAFQADSIWIYKNFRQFGTTANLRLNHNHLDSLNNQKTLISNEDLKTIMEIASRAKRKKLYQKKYGSDICYWIIEQEGVKKKFVAYGNSKIAEIDDLDSMRTWIITEPNDVLLFEEILNKYWL